ncbi:MAG: hypothetical protein M1816_001035 [Peltula sp. TS41687]|nr:MAG: hypothetical protein M1816_001035 [Peltula sp. TS41687]
MASSLSLSSRLYAAYPPKVTEMTVLGYVLDVNNRGYSRDVGRSSILGDRVFYQFGDTFCKDQNGDFCGIVCHTCAIVPSVSNPTRCEYLNIATDGKVACFVPYTTDEKGFEANTENHGRVTLWSFGGTAEDSPGCGSGWCWFEKGEIYDGGRCVPLGTGVVRVLLDTDSELDPRNVIALRPAEYIFGPDEPRWGTFSTLVKDGYAYLWGHHENDVLLGRVNTRQPLLKSAYEFWNGSTYVKDWRAAQPVMHGMSQGEVYRSNLFWPGQGRDYVCIGVSSQATSKILMSVAGQLEGPWQEWFEIGDATSLDCPSGYRYCIYPHPWAFREQDGELMVTWCEPWPGAVIAAKLTFEREKESIQDGVRRAFRQVKEVVKQSPLRQVREVVNNQLKGQRSKQP